MKNLTISFGFLLFPLLLLAAPVTFFIENMENAKGKVFVGVYQEDGFLKEGKRVKECSSVGKLEEKRVRVRCELQPGSYAAYIYHDENENNELDTNFIGIPKEGYGFTNNPKFRFGPPLFHDTSFSVTNQPVELKINLNY